jgi:hypothetical protein
MNDSEIEITLKDGGWINLKKIDNDYELHVGSDGHWPGVTLLDNGELTALRDALSRMLEESL